MAALWPLQSQWATLYTDRLPGLAKARDPVQPRWPIFLDHCFARVVLDNAVGRDRPWTEAVRAPATKNMSEQQLRDAIALANDIADGTANLEQLDQRSLHLRGKSGSRKRTVRETEHESRMTKKPRTTAVQSDIRSHFQRQQVGAPPLPDRPENTGPAEELQRMRHTLKVAADLTPFRKSVLMLLTYIPEGRYSTYGAMSDYVSQHGQKCSARAIGNAMRNNPYAPAVPCHRVLAHDGTIGGYGGFWGEQGKNAAEKRRVLAGEGVRFSSTGKAIGAPFKDFDCEHVLCQTKGS